MKSIFMKKSLCGGGIFYDRLDIPANLTASRAFHNKIWSYHENHVRLYSFGSDYPDLCDWLIDLTRESTVRNLLRALWQLDEIVVDENQSNIYANFVYGGYVRTELLGNEQFWIRLTMPYVISLPGGSIASPFSLIRRIWRAI